MLGVDEWISSDYVADLRNLDLRFGGLFYLPTMCHDSGVEPEHVQDWASRYQHLGVAADSQLAFLSE